MWHAHFVMSKMVRTLHELFHLILMKLPHLIPKIILGGIYYWDSHLQLKKWRLRYAKLISQGQKAKWWQVC